MYNPDYWDRTNINKRYIHGPYEKLPNCVKELLSDDEKKERKRVGLRVTEQVKMGLKLVELKETAKKNYILTSKMEGDKRLKSTWVKAVNRIPANWSFNTFMVGITSNKRHILNGQMDVLLRIQKFM